MTERDNDTPGQPALRVGFIAHAPEARELADAIQARPNFELIAQAGLPKTAALPDVEWFDDQRVLIAQSGIEALMLGTSPRAGIELGEIAAGHGVHVWRIPPLGRNFAEAGEALRRFRNADIVYQVASWWELVGQAVRWAQGAHADAAAVFSEVLVRAAGPVGRSWRASQIDAGGGVLVGDAYGMLEALIAVRGLPESVLAAVGKCRRQTGEVPRETEDVAAAILHYEGGGVALVRATWDIQPFERHTLHHARGLTVRLDAERVSIRGADGALLDERALPTDFLPSEMTRFAQAVQRRKPDEAATGTLERHLAVTALLEAIYLSARTGQPETPRQLYEVQGWPEPVR